MVRQQTLLDLQGLLELHKKTGFIQQQPDYREAIFIGERF